MSYSYAQDLLTTCPVCQRRKPSRWLLCKGCAGEYGLDPKCWSEWLRFLVSDIRREAYQECVSDLMEVSLDGLYEAGVEVAVDIHGNPIQGAT